MVCPLLNLSSHTDPATTVLEMVRASTDSVIPLTPANSTVTPVARASHVCAPTPRLWETSSSRGSRSIRFSRTVCMMETTRPSTNLHQLPLIRTHLVALMVPGECSPRPGMTFRSSRHRPRSGSQTSHLRPFHRCSTRLGSGWTRRWRRSCTTIPVSCRIITLFLV